MTFNIKLEGGEAVLDALRKVSQAHNLAAARLSFRTMAHYAFRRVMDRTPGSGTLRGAWRIETKETKNQIEWRIYNKLADQGVTYESTDGTTKPKLKTFPSSEQQTWGDVISILDKGGKPHEITPKRVKWLSWWASGRGSQVGSRFAVFTKHVAHPGHKAYGMISDTVAELDKLFEATVKERKRSVLSAWAIKGTVPQKAKV